MVKSQVWEPFQKVGDKEGAQLPNEVDWTKHYSVDELCSWVQH